MASFASLWRDKPKSIILMGESSDSVKNKKFFETKTFNMVLENEDSVVRTITIQVPNE